MFFNIGYKVLLTLVLTEKHAAWATTPGPASVPSLSDTLSIIEVKSIATSTISGSTNATSCDLAIQFHPSDRSNAAWSHSLTHLSTASPASHSFVEPEANMIVQKKKRQTWSQFTNWQTGGPQSWDNVASAASTLAATSAPAAASSLLAASTLVNASASAALTSLAPDYDTSSSITSEAFPQESSSLFSESSFGAVAQLLHKPMRIVLVVFTVLEIVMV